MKAKFLMGLGLILVLIGLCSGIGYGIFSIDETLLGRIGGGFVVWLSFTVPGLLYGFWGVNTRKWPKSRGL